MNRLFHASSGSSLATPVRARARNHRCTPVPDVIRTIHRWGSAFVGLSIASDRWLFPSVALARARTEPTDARVEPGIGTLGRWIARHRRSVRGVGWPIRRDGSASAGIERGKRIDEPGTRGHQRKKRLHQPGSSILEPGSAAVERGSALIEWRRAIMQRWIGFVGRSIPSVGARSATADRWSRDHQRAVRRGERGI